MLLVDDGSTDGSPTICQKYADENPNLVEYLLKANGGLSDARNYGLQHVDASYVLFIDSDDYVESGMLERMLENLQRPKEGCGMQFLLAVSGQNGKRRRDGI